MGKRTNNPGGVTISVGRGTNGVGRGPHGAGRGTRSVGTGTNSVGNASKLTKAVSARLTSITRLETSHLFCRITYRSLVGAPYVEDFWKTTNLFHIIVWSKHSLEEPILRKTIGERVCND